MSKKVTVFYYVPAENKVYSVYVNIESHPSNQKALLPPWHRSGEVVAVKRGWLSDAKRKDLEEHYLKLIKKRKLKNISIHHTYLGRDMGGERIDEVGIDGEVYVIYGAPSKDGAIRFAKRIYIEGYLSGRYVYSPMRRRK